MLPTILRTGLLIFCSLQAIALEVPRLDGRIVDKAGALSPQARHEIEQILEQHERRTTNQIVVLVIRSLNGDSLESFSERVATQWKLGQKGRDNGVLFLIVTEDRKVRVEVGYGLESVIPDVKSSFIVRERVLPYFRKNDIGGGVQSGVLALTEALGEKASEPGPMDQPSSGEVRFIETPRDPSDNPAMALFVLVLLGFFTFFVVQPGAPWLLYYIFIPFWAGLPAFALGLKSGLLFALAYVIFAPCLKLLLKKLGIGMKFGSPGNGETSRGRFDRHTSDSSGDSSSSSSDDSSFSGGGGRFGGGGSSDSW